MKNLIFAVLFLSALVVANAQNSESGASIIPSGELKFPFVGAQVFIEPGQSPELIDSWFRTMKDKNFTLCRIRMFESYMTRENGERDFSLFDNAFRSAEKYGIKVFATIFPMTEKTDIGGFKFPRDEEHLKSISLFIKDLTTHFSQFRSLYGYVLINEPGTSGKVPWTKLTREKYNEWKQTHPVKEYTEKGYPVLVDMSEQAFLYDLNTWYLKWIADEIRKYDSAHELHVNNHAMFQNCAEYNFPEWRQFLTSLGGSAHASWHFGYFTRQQYALAMSANSEMVRSGAGNLPWLMTELQGGNNTYSGGAPMCPTKEEISQWLWLIVASEGKGGIFWTLNPRSSGIEAGEWALIDFQGNPSDRMKEAGSVARTFETYQELLGKSREAETGINILYVRQSLWAESKMATGSAQNFEARKPGGVMKSALGYFEALSQMGLNVNLRAFEEFDFSKEDYSNTTIILAHQISMPKNYAAILEGYVKKGGKLIVDGLTGFFDENLHNTMNTGFDYEKLFGGNIREFKLIDDIFRVKWQDYSIPAHLWQGLIYPGAGTTASTSGTDIFALRNHIGKGEVLWVPSLLGLGARIANNYSPLARFLESEVSSRSTVKFKSFRKDLLMKTLVSGSSQITIIINKRKLLSLVPLDFGGRELSGNILYSNKNGKLNGTTVQIDPEETMVIEWK